MRKIEVAELMIEVGRRCNLNCDHCLRGESDKFGSLIISKEIINATLKDICTISTLTLTGGEPFLYPEIISYIADTIAQKKINLCGFFIATNGTVMSEKALLALIKLYRLAEDKDYCNIRISDDEFHKQERQRNDVDIDPVFGMFSSDFVHKDQTKYKPEYLINQGNAAINLDARKNPRDDGFMVSDEGDPIIVEGNIYVNTNGGILSGCDYSYENQEYALHGNILEQNLYEILEIQPDKEIHQIAV